ncbi:MAG: gfo/Idh/MocA family oxidoreductase [Nitrospira sp. WS238]|nr:gfo/Idh/MocA family oxidoreductase [Nitrospira sp. WS238]
MPGKAQKPKSRPQRIRYAVVGLGHLAQIAVLPAFRNARRNSELVTVVSGDEKKRREIGRRYKLLQTYAYDQYDELLTNGTIDAIYVALPNNLHRSYVERASRAGIHVLCEKPLGLTEVDCRAMVRAAKQNRTQLMVAYRLHFDEANLRMIEVAHSGRLGEVRIFHSLFTQQVKAGDTRLQARVGGGPLLDIGIYCINAARYLFQSEPIDVFAAASRSNDVRFQEVPEMYAVIMRFPGDRLATFTSSFGAADRAEYDLVGTSGTLRLENAYEYTEGMRALITVGNRTETIRYPRRDQFGPQLLYFSDCILHKRTPQPSGLEGTVDVAIIEALHQSAVRGRVVKIRLRATPARRPRLSQAARCRPVSPPPLVRASSPTK